MTLPRIYLTTIDRLALYRAANPQSRALNVLRNTGGGTAKNMVCVLCGAAGPGWCGRYRKTVKQEVWETEHVAQHKTEEGKLSIRGTYEQIRNLLLGYNRLSGEGRKPITIEEIIKFRAERADCGHEDCRKNPEMKKLCILSQEGI